jgi:hypothetical protein
MFLLMQKGVITLELVEVALFRHPNLNIFSESGPHAIFHIHRKTSSGRKVTGTEEERKSLKNALNSGHYAPPATPTGSERTSLRQTFSQSEKAC